jgi:hypothetical protein
MFQLVIAVYGYVMATGIDCFILVLVVLFKSLGTARTNLFWSKIAVSNNGKVGPEEVS